MEENKAEVPTTEADLHAGHRDRLRQEIEENGISEKNEHRIVEFLLFYAIPYKDTRPLARRLIGDFGNLHGVLNAPQDQLIRYKGMTKNAALFLNMMAKIADRYLYESFDVKTVRNTKDVLNQVKRYVTPGLESCFLVSLGVAEELVAVLKVAEGVKNALEIPVRDIVRMALVGGAFRVVLVHNHPSGVNAPSQADWKYTYSVVQAFRLMNIEIVDHILVYNETAYSMKANKVYKHNWRKEYGYEEDEPLWEEDLAAEKEREKSES